MLSKNESVSIDEAVALFEREKDAIWLEAPEEILVLSKGASPRGIGSRGQYLTPIMFAEGTARSLGDETLWGILQLCDKPGMDLGSLKAAVAQFVRPKAAFFELFGLEHVVGVVMTYMRVAENARSTADLKRLTAAMMSYANRVHVWIDAAYPWGVCSGYMRPKQERAMPEFTGAGKQDRTAGRVTQVALNMAGRDVCVAEIWEDKAPGIAAALRGILPVTTIAQHGKIVGDLLFFSLPLVLAPENAFLLQDLCRTRRQEKGTASGALCFYHPRQQICIYYGDDVADEPAMVSYIGEIVDGEKELKLASMECWTSPGETLTMRLA